MDERFTYSGLPCRVVFGSGAIDALAGEMDALGVRKAFIITMPQEIETGRMIGGLLGARAASVFSGAVMHTPVSVTEHALRAFRGVEADCTVAVGGGSTTGLGRALALRTDLPQIVIPTTCAGSEMRPILIETAGGRKTTQRSLRVMPETVIHDVELTLGLPHAVAYNARAAPEAMARIAAAIGAAGAAQGLFDLIGRLDGRRSLAAIGMPADGIDRAADEAVATPYWNPRPLAHDSIRGLIARAFVGDRPEL
jgi:maleylacetate reductase